MKKFFFGIFFLFGFSLLFAVPVKAAEIIHSYHSDLHVRTDGSLDVTEIIVVNAENDQINHGIYRDIPFVYRGKFGEKYTLGFTLEEVTQDGVPAFHHTVDKKNGIRIYIGNASTIITPGTHTYTITYSVSRALGSFEEHDELYWNVTGNDWAFPITSASARVFLPVGVPESSIKIEGFTGETGSTEKNIRTNIIKNTPAPTIEFFTTTKLQTQEGLTIVVGWQPGFIPRITEKEKIYTFLKENWEIGVGALGFLIALLYYLFAWYKVGRDPEKGVIIAQYDAPKDMSPAKARYIMKRSVDDAGIGAQIIDMAHRGLVSIEVTDSSYIIHRSPEQTTPHIYEEDTIILNKLFVRPEKKTFIISKKSHSSRAEYVFGEITKRLQEKYRKEVNGALLMFNRSYLLHGVGLSCIFLIGIWLISIKGFSSLIALSMWVIITGTTMFITRKAWKKRTKTESNVLTAMVVLSGGCSIVFSCMGVILVLSLFSEVAGSFFILFFLFIALHVLFSYLLQTPSIEGRKALDYLEGFKLFLSVTEKDRLHFFHPPDRTPELFQQHLSFAFALGVEQAWAKQFTDVFRVLEKTETNRSFITNTGSPLTLTSLVSSLKDISSSITSASNRPSSNSGFSGGSSGGGGGGGGGGGW